MAKSNSSQILEPVLARLHIIHKSCIDLKYYYIFNKLIPHKYVQFVIVLSLYAPPPAYTPAPPLPSPVPNTNWNAAPNNIALLNRSPYEIWKVYCFVTVFSKMLQLLLRLRLLPRHLMHHLRHQSQTWNETLNQKGWLCSVEFPPRNLKKKNVFHYNISWSTSLLKPTIGFIASQVDFKWRLTGSLAQ